MFLERKNYELVSNPFMMDLTEKCVWARERESAHLCVREREKERRKVRENLYN